MVDWRGKRVEGRNGTKIPGVRIGVVGMELLHGMLLKLKKKKLKENMGMFELCPDENILNIVKKKKNKKPPIF